MPFDGKNFPAVETDEVLRALKAMREFHSSPANWCNTGPTGKGDSACIAVAISRLGYGDNASKIFPYLFGALPSDAFGHKWDGIIYFNEHRGTTHAELMAFYDRAIAARRAELTQAA